MIATLPKMFHTIPLCIYINILLTMKVINQKWINNIDIAKYEIATLIALNIYAYEYFAIFKLWENINVVTTAYNLHQCRLKQMRIKCFVFLLFVFVFSLFMKPSSS